MFKIAIGVVVAGIVYTTALALTGNLDLYAAIVFALVVAAGFLSIAVVRKSSSGSTAPVACAECGGLLSPNAPYCKHCGAPRSVD
ncbi:MAG: hypothetical protein M3161_01245 [Actinomycetota bacterium]|nr:hypothetical protein [Actinomycetota bacterium]